MSAIVTRLAEPVLHHVITCQTAHEVWSRLHSIYEKSGETSLMLQQQRFVALKFEDDMSVADFISKVQEQQQTLKRLGEAVTDRMAMSKIIMSLPLKYAHFVSAWESCAQEKQTMDNLTARLLVEEERLNNKCSSKAEESVALFSKGQKGTNKGNFKCFLCHKPGHLKKDCKLKNVCFKCNKPGHFKDKCKASKNDKKDKKNSDTGNKKTESAFVSTVLVSASDRSIDEKWLVDSGASHHMTYQKELFCEYEKLSTPKVVIIGDGRKLNALEKNAVEIVRDVTFVKKHNKPEREEQEEKCIYLDIEENLNNEEYQSESDTEGSVEFEDCQVNDNMMQEVEFLEEEILEHEEIQEVNESMPVNLENTRRTRSRKAPNWFHDYEVGFISVHNEPSTLKEAMECEDKENWIEAMNREITTLKENNTWTEVAMLPKGIKAINKTSGLNEHQLTVTVQSDLRVKNSAQTSLTMNTLVVLSVIFAVSVAAPYNKNGQAEEKPLDDRVLDKRSIGHIVYSNTGTGLVETYLEPHFSYAVPAAAYVVPSAVSHQSRVDVHSSPAIVSTKTKPESVLVATVPSAYVPTVYSGASAVSHQSRVDIKSSPAIVTEQVLQPTYFATSHLVQAPAVFEEAPTVVDARSLYGAPVATVYSSGIW
ncbi:unnamed protein product, partial [Brenthis ino]